MRRRLWSGVVALSAVALLLGVGLVGSNPAAPTALAQNEYVGAARCAECHPEPFAEWQASGHAHILIPAEEAQTKGLPKPDYVEWDDVLFVIGGFDWKARYIGKDGFIITQSADGTVQGENQFNLETEEFVDYHPGEEKPYTCGSCHTTGFNPEGNQMGLPGLRGTWALENVQCERCHGPGGKHVATRSAADVQKDDSPELCGQCHHRGDDMNVIPAKGGFIRHHEQYQEFRASPHRNLKCVTCHDPHKTSGLSIKTTCATCHPRQAEEFTGSAMQQAGLRCEDCHMAEATKSAIRRGPFEGDVMTHLFRINIDPNAPQFTEDGSAAMPYLTLSYVCLPCHADRDAAWAAEYARQAHTLGK